MFELNHNKNNVNVLKCFAMLEQNEDLHYAYQVYKLNTQTEKHIF